MDVPEGWRASTVEDTCEILDRLRVPLNAEQRLSMKGEYPYWGANNIVDYVNDFIFDEPLVLMAEDGGYFSEAQTRPICNLLDGKCWVNNHAHVIRVGSENLREWVYYWFVHRDITTYIKGGTRTKLNQQDLKKLPILLPPLSEQKKIAEILGSVDEAIQAMQAVIDQTRKVKQGLLQQLLTRGIGHTRFQQTEIGRIPESWAVVRTDHAGEVKLGRMRSHVYTDGELRPYLRVANVLDGQLSLSDVHEMLFTPEEFETFRLRDGDVLLCEGQSTHLVGRAAMYRGSPSDCAYQKALLRFRAGAAILPEYSLALFQHYLYSGRFAEIAVQTTSMAHLTAVRFSAMPIPVPPLSEQEAIVEKYTTIGHAVDQNVDELRRLNRLKQGLMGDLLSGRVRVKVDA
jgi:type I restriction enzyme S subunit